MTPADDPVSGIFRKTKNRRGGGDAHTRIMLGIPGAKAVHHYVPHFEVVAQVVIMLLRAAQGGVRAPWQYHGG